LTGQGACAEIQVVKGSFALMKDDFDGGVRDKKRRNRSFIKEMLETYRAILPDKGRNRPQKLEGRYAQERKRKETRKKGSLSPMVLLTQRNLSVSKSQQTD